MHSCTKQIAGSNLLQTGAGNSNVNGKVSKNHVWVLDPLVNGLSDLMTNIKIFWIAASVWSEFMKSVWQLEVSVSLGDWN